MERSEIRGSIRGAPLRISPIPAQRRQADAGGVEAAVDAENLPGDVAGAIAAQKEHRLRQLLLEAVAVERNRGVIIGADLRGVNLPGHRGLDRAGCDAVDADA